MVAWIPRTLLCACNKEKGEQYQIKKARGNPMGKEAREKKAMAMERYTSTHTLYYFKNERKNKGKDRHNC